MEKSIKISAQKEVNPNNLATITNLQKEWGITRTTIYNWLNSGIISKVEYLGLTFIDKSTFKPKMSKAMIETIIANNS